MKMEKILKHLAVFIFIISCFVLSGCNSDSKEIKIGGNFELTGKFTSEGKAALNGVKMAIKEINQAGGVLGKKIVLIDSDNHSSAKEASEISEKLIKQDKVSAILGAATTAPTLAMLPVSQENKVPFIAITATNAKITNNNGQVNEYAFRACFVDSFQGASMADFVINKLNLNKAVIYIDEESEYSKELAEAFKNAFEKKGGVVLTEFFYKEDSKGDNKEIAEKRKNDLEKIKVLGPQFVYLPGMYEDFGAIVKQARTMGLKVPFLAGDGIDSAGLIGIAGIENLQNCYYSTHYFFDEKNEKIVKFVQDYKKEYGIEPDSSAILGYDAVTMLVDAIKRGNSIKPEDIKNALATIQNLDGLTGSISMNEMHDPKKGIFIIEIEKGKKVLRDYIGQ